MESVLTQIIQEIGSSGAEVFGRNRIMEILSGKLAEEKKMVDSAYQRGRVSALQEQSQIKDHTSQIK